MKLIRTVLAACLGLLTAPILIGLPICTAFASDAGSALRVDEAVQQDIGALTQKLSRNDTGKQTWYDISRTAEVRSYSFDVLQESGSLQRALRQTDTAAYLVPCGDGASMSEAVFRTDKRGILTYIATVPLNGLQPFDPNAIAAQLSGWEISDLQLCTDPAMRFVWFESGGTEYAIVCSFLPDFYAYSCIPMGSVIQMDELLEWVQQLPEAEHTDAAASVYGAVSLNTDEGAGQHGLSLPAVIISAAAGILLAYAVAHGHQTDRETK